IRPCSTWAIRSVGTPTTCHTRSAWKKWKTSPRFYAGCWPSAGFGACVRPAGAGALAVAPGLAQIEPDTPHGRVFVVADILEPQVRHQAQHGAIRRQDQAVYIRKSLFLSRVNQAAHQLGPQAATLPGVSDDQGVFGAAPIGIAQVVGEADDLLARVAPVLGVGNL